ncbi:TPA: hypothetical protein ACS773_002147 [Providencia alcalifaciens]
MDKSRQQFEEWRSKNKSSTINLFDVWQASRESLINSLEPVGYMESNGINYINKHGFTHINAEQSGSINIPLYKLD